MVLTCTVVDIHVMCVRMYIVMPFSSLIWPIYFISRFFNYFTQYSLSILIGGNAKEGDEIKQYFCYNTLAKLYSGVLV